MSLALLSVLATLLCLSGCSVAVHQESCNVNTTLTECTQSTCPSIAACIRLFNTSTASSFDILVVESKPCVNNTDECDLSFGATWRIIGADPTQHLCCSSVSTTKSTVFKTLSAQSLRLPASDLPFFDLSCNSDQNYFFQNLVAEGHGPHHPNLLFLLNSRGCTMTLKGSTISNQDTVILQKQGLVTPTDSGLIRILRCQFIANSQVIQIVGSQNHSFQSLLMKDSFIDGGNTSGGGIMLNKVKAYFESVDFFHLAIERKDGEGVIIVDNSLLTFSRCHFRANIIKSTYAGFGLISAFKSNLIFDSLTSFTNNVIHSDLLSVACGIINFEDGGLISSANFNNNTATPPCSTAIFADIDDAGAVLLGGSYINNHGAPVVQFTNYRATTEFMFDTRGTQFKGNKCNKTKYIRTCDLYFGTQLPTKMVLDLNFSSEDECIRLCGNNNAACSMEEQACLLSSNSNFLCNSDGDCVSQWIHLKVLNLEAQFWFLVLAGILLVFCMIFFGLGCCSVSLCKEKVEYDLNSVVEFSRS